jgi:hypothetical protein
MSTSTALPESLAAFFQEYDVHGLDLDLDRDRDLIIERTLGAGNLAELRWLFSQFSHEAIQGWIQRRGAARLPYRRFNLWCVVFEIEHFEHPRYWRQTSWPY